MAPRASRTYTAPFGQRPLHGSHRVDGVIGLNVPCPGRSQNPSRDANCKAGPSGCRTSSAHLLRAPPPRTSDATAQKHPPSPGTPSPEHPVLTILGWAISEPARPHKRGETEPSRPAVPLATTSGGWSAETHGRIPLHHTPWPRHCSAGLRAAQTPSRRGTLRQDVLALLTIPNRHIATALNKIPRERSAAASCCCQACPTAGDGLDRRCDRRALVPPYERAAAGTNPVRVTIACIAVLLNMASVHFRRTLLAGATSGVTERGEVAGWAVARRSLRCCISELSHDGDGVSGAY
ncbi:hypothetical protein G7Z17_g12395 [Cylindrodendrum hubeiense]|uniref:Uncharacterized protein n=1 Tax=Cylindrodendrum hubeiense TaxID=595255 RepID=A0A9P5GYF0_9HYPO|nr:hypothetical protein G7Z17_g12395 [Cylindrodendrum hubeiense]